MIIANVFKLLSVQMTAFLITKITKTALRSVVSTDMASKKINDDKIQDFRKALMISEDDDREENINWEWCAQVYTMTTNPALHDEP